MLCSSAQESGDLLRVGVTRAHIHAEDQEEGEERPELDLASKQKQAKASKSFCLQISPAGSRLKH